MERFFQCLINAITGLRIAFRSERNLNIQAGFALVTVLTGFAAQLKPKEWIMTLFCIGSVLTLELVNTAIEELCNLVDSNHNRAIGKIKDISAGAVLATALFSTLIGAIIFTPYFLNFLKSIEWINF